VKSTLSGPRALVAILVIANTSSAAEIQVTNDIAVATTWTQDNTYDLQNQIHVLPGASLTIEAGTVVASTPTPNGSGSLAVAKGAQIFVQGTEQDPVIMTSTADVATWTGGDPKTGVWREAASEWGNLTILGGAYISENANPGNVPTCNASNVAQMEGLVAQFPGDPVVMYGGGNDADDSGTIAYLSIRYGGRVVGLANELNGLSLGGVGHGTDIHHVEIMNNVDDGIEIWGGTVNLQYFDIWNVGDDSLDVDQGWRGKAQFGLIVQGYSADAPQGSGVGDNCIETDGAEDSDWQPVTTASLYNLTVIGQPISGDGGTAWRDNARVQYRQCVWMDLGGQLVRFDDLDGDGAQGYGHNGTLSWAATWSTPWNAVPAHPNDCPPGTYQAQVDGQLAEIKDSVMFNNGAGNAYTEATARGVFDGPNMNAQEPPQPPIAAIQRGAQVQKGGLPQVRVTFLDPRARNDAATAALNCPAPNDGFFLPTAYRGAFSPSVNWLCGWTAACAFGFTAADNVVTPGEDVQDAIDAAAPGSVITVQAGSYPGFAIDGKPLTILGSGTTEIAGAVTISNLPPGEIAVLGDLQLNSLDALANAGTVILSAVTFSEDFATSPVDRNSLVDIQGSADVRASEIVVDLLGELTSQHAIGVDASRVEIAEAVVFGADGADSSGDEEGGPGGFGLLVGNGARAHSALSSLSGGLGGFSTGLGPNGGDGGHATQVEGSSELILTGVLPDTRFVGGTGRRALFGYDGRGGDAVSLLNDEQPKFVRHSGVDLDPGAGGQSADDGDPIGGAQVTDTVVVPPDDDPSLELIGVPQTDVQFTLRVHAPAGSTVALNSGTQPLVLDDGLAPIELLVAVTNTQNLGVVPPSGTLDVPIVLSDPPGSLRIYQADVTNGPDLFRTNSVPVVIR